ncbi:MAG: hypothetical protein M9890_11900 [Thermomicrobiales bacterium]|nr:hypothetical protein [Thermomicrobiales bacterium]
MQNTIADHSRRFLFVLWNGGGNVPPQLAIARRLVERGHDVRILAPQSLAQQIAAAGCVHVPYVHAPEHDSASPDTDILCDWQARTPIGAAASVRDRLMAGPAELFARDVVEAVERNPVDVVVTDYMLLGAYVGAERAGLPFAALIHHIYPLPDPALPPFGFGLQPARRAPERLRETVLRRAFARFYGAALPPVNNARVALGLRSLASIFDVFAQPDRVLVLSSRAFDFPASALPDTVRYVGVQHVDEAAERWDDPWSADDARPLIVVSFSTTYQRQQEVLQRVTSALGELPVRALITAGSLADSLVVPANCVVRAWVPHEQVFPSADLVVTHGGHGTVTTALAHGVPVLCLPMGRDQADVAARAIWRGAGRALSSRSKPAAIRTALAQMLAEPQFRVAAQHVAAAMEQGVGEARVIDELEALGRVFAVSS